MKELYRFREFLKEDQSLDGLKKAKPGTTVTVGKDKYVKQAEKNATMGKTNHLWWKKNKLDKLVHSKELAKLTEGKVVGRRLNESAPGYDTRKFGGALPTLESVQAAYEDKEEPRDGVKSAAEKLGMKPSHVKEDTNLAEGKELDVIETDNRDSKYTILRLSNGDYVEVNVIELYQNLIDNQSDDV